MSEEVVRILVGSVGLVLAIPVTTLIAVLVVKANGAGVLPGRPTPPDITVTGHGTPLQLSPKGTGPEQ